MRNPVRDDAPGERGSDSRNGSELFLGRDIDIHRREFVEASRAPGGALSLGERLQSPVSPRRRQQVRAEGIFMGTPRDIPFAIIQGLFGNRGRCAVGAGRSCRAFRARRAFGAFRAFRAFGAGFSACTGTAPATGDRGIYEANLSRQPRPSGIGRRGTPLARLPPADGHAKGGYASKEDQRAFLSRCRHTPQ
jgi:hypothetical protein